MEMLIHGVSALRVASESLVEIHDSSMCLVGMPFAKGVPCLLGCLNVVEHGDHILINR